MPSCWQRSALIGSLATAAIAVWASPVGAAPPPGPPAWSDEFDGDSLDLTRWNHRASGPRHDGVLTPLAVSVADGMLTIKTYTELGRHFSGMISSHRRGSQGHEQAYGHFEARVRFHGAPGQWSAFWLQSRTIGDPVGDPETAGVEMDIAEHRERRCVSGASSAPPTTCSADEPVSDRIQQALIWDGYGADSKAAVKLSDPLAGLVDGSWHRWALRWSPTALTFYYDDMAIWSPPGPISRSEQYVILSSEVGRYFAGAIPAGGYGARATSTTNMQVDWVRVWELPDPAVAPQNATAPALTGTPEVGRGLACAIGSWSGDPAPSFGFEWRRDGSAIAGASAAAYTVAAADRGHTLTCRVTATNTAGSAAASSNALLVPAPAPPPPASLPAPLAPVARSVPVDTVAPAARLSGRTTQPASASVAVTIACPDEACRATVTGTVRVPRVGRFAARTYRPAAITTAIAGGESATVRLRLSRSARATIRRALRVRRRIVLRLAVRVVDDAGNGRTLRRQVVLRL